MLKSINVWVCQNKDGKDLCVSPATRISPEEKFWTSSRDSPTGWTWAWLARSHPGFSVFDQATKWPNKIKATLIYESTDADNTDNFKLI